jgi:hypothetical protein
MDEEKGADPQGGQGSYAYLGFSQVRSGDGAHASDMSLALGACEELHHSDSMTWKGVFVLPSSTRALTPRTGRFVCV